MDLPGSESNSSDLFIAIPAERNLFYLMYSTYTSSKVLHFSKAVLADTTFKIWDNKGRVKTP